MAVHARDSEGQVSQPAGTTASQDTAPDAYETDDVPALAGVILVNDQEGPQSRNFHDAGDADWVMFHGIAGKVYEITAFDQQSSCNVVLQLYDTDGTTLLEEQDGLIAGEDELISWTCPADGIYYVKVAGYESSQTGSYGLEIQAWNIR